MPARVSLRCLSGTVAIRFSLVLKYWKIDASCTPESLEISAIVVSWKPRDAKMRSADSKMSWRFLSAEALVLFVGEALLTVFAGNPL
jgi:hypothetical protein